MKREAPFQVKSFLGFILLAGLAFSFWKILWDAKYKGSPKPADLPVYGQIPEFTLAERSLSKVTRSDLEGKIWIADFIFTHCAGVCPLMSSKMKGLQEKLGHYPDIRLVSFSVDPERDTPEVLARYGERYQADPVTWLFLTGDKEIIYRLSAQHFHLGVEEIPAQKREALDQSVRHSSKFALVDGSGKIRGYYDSESSMALEQLVKDAERLLAQNRTSKKLKGS